MMTDPIALQNPRFLRAFKYYHKPCLKINTKLFGTAQNNAENCPINRDYFKENCE
jgi:hypothetical protein